MPGVPPAGAVAIRRSSRAAPGRVTVRPAHPGDRLAGLLQILARARHGNPRRVQRVVPRQLGQAMRRDGLGRAVAEAVAPVVRRQVRHRGQPGGAGDGGARGARRERPAGYDWTEVIAPDGTVGWVAGRYLAPYRRYVAP